MKAILIVDVPDDWRCTEWCIEGELRGKNEDGEWIFCNEIVEAPLKPMPEPIYVEVNGFDDIMHTEFSIENLSAKIRLDTDKIFSLGWNACLKEIGDDGKW